MDELIKTFHIEVNLLVAQMVNFAIVLFVLYRFAYKPVLKTLNSRTNKIEKGLADADAAGKKLEEIVEKEKDVLATAKKEAQEIIKMAEEQAKANSMSIVLEARNQSEKLLVGAKSQIEQEKNKMLVEVKGEIANLVVLATEKIIGEKLDKEKDRELIEKSIK
ncbi:MAG: F0F1 ATP synthase subunit B [Candidatus Moranbacteria bacterium]|nr:F0F1 ATP synthase subunit B [Candidatus Moranbacteria bacterium]